MHRWRIERFRVQTVVQRFGMARIEIPEALGRRFAVEDARRHGVSPSRLRSGGLDRPFYGVRSIPTVSDVDRNPAAAIRENAACFATRMADHEFFSHVTSAALWELPLPPRAVRQTSVDVGVLAPRRPPRGRGVDGHQLRPSLVKVVEHPDCRLRLLDAASTWASLAASLHPYDLVALGDAIVRDWRLPVGCSPLATVAELEALVCAGRRVGVGALRAALPRIRTRSASRTETWLRLTLVDGALPEPELNAPVQLGVHREVALDLAYRRERVGIEYEGDHHRVDADQWHADLERYELLADAGWRIIRVTRHDLFATTRALIARVRAALAAAS